MGFEERRKNAMIGKLVVSHGRHGPSQARPHAKPARSLRQRAKHRIDAIGPGRARSYVDAAVGVRGATTAVAAGATAATAAVAVAVIVGLAIVGLAIAIADLIAVHPGEDAGEEEHDAVHDAEGEAGLEHGAGLVDVDVDADVEGRAAQRSQRYRYGIPRPHRRAVRRRHHPHRVHRSDERTHEQQVHDPDRPRVRG